MFIVDFGVLCLVRVLLFSILCLSSFAIILMGEKRDVCFADKFDGSLTASDFGVAIQLP